MYVFIFYQFSPAVALPFRNLKTTDSLTGFCTNILETLDGKLQGAETFLVKILLLLFFIWHTRAVLHYIANITILDFCKTVTTQIFTGTCIDSSWEQFKQLTMKVHSGNTKSLAAAPWMSTYPRTDEYWWRILGWKVPVMRLLHFSHCAAHGCFPVSDRSAVTLHLNKYRQNVNKGKWPH